MKEKIISLKNGTIYGLISLLGIILPLSTSIYGFKDKNRLLFLRWIFVIYAVMMLVFFIIRSKDKKAIDVPSLVGLGILLVLIILTVIDFI